MPARILPGEETGSAAADSPRDCLLPSLSFKTRYSGLISQRRIRTVLPALSTMAKPKAYNPADNNGFQQPEPGD